MLWASSDLGPHCCKFHQYTINRLIVLKYLSVLTLFLSDYKLVDTRRAEGFTEPPNDTTTHVCDEARRHDVCDRLCPGGLYQGD